MIDCVINTDTDSHFPQYYHPAHAAVGEHFYCIIPSLHSVTTNTKNAAQKLIEQDKSETRTETYYLLTELALAKFIYNILFMNQIDK